MNDQDLERLAQRLGTRAAERLDVEATARTVLERLRHAAVKQRVTWMRPEWMRVAAVLVLLLGAGVALQRVSAPVGPPTYALEDLSDLTVSELTLMLGTIEGTLGDSNADDADADLENLTPAQLQALLRSLET